MAEGQQQQQPTWTPQQIEAWRGKVLAARKAARDKRGTGGHIWAKPTGSYRTIYTPGGMRRIKIKPGQRISTGGGTASANPYLDSLHALRRGTDAPVRLGKMSWKGHGASPQNREKRKVERQIRHARQVAKRDQARADDAAIEEQDRRDYWETRSVNFRRDLHGPEAKEARRKGKLDQWIADYPFK